MQILKELFDNQDLLAVNKNEKKAFSYLWRTENVTLPVPDEAQSKLTMVQSDQMPEDRVSVAEINLPFGIGDVVYVQEPFRLNAWDLDAEKVMFEYEDGTLSRAIEIHDSDFYEKFFGDAQVRSFNFNNSAFLIYEINEAQQIGRWYPAEEMPREAVRIINQITNVTPVKLYDITDEQAQSQGYKNAEEMIADVQSKDPCADSKSWILIVEASKWEMPEIKLWSSSPDVII